MGEKKNPSGGKRSANPKKKSCPLEGEEEPSIRGENERTLAERKNNSIRKKNKKTLSLPSTKGGKGRR